MPIAMENRAPGVYLEEVTIRPGPALETGVPVFLGRLSPSGAGLPPFSGAAGRVIAIDYTTWAALSQGGGTAWAQGFLGFAVRGFFENGGLRCHLALYEDNGFQAALDGLAALDDFDVVCAPDMAGNSTAHAQMLQLCAARPGCFALLDAAGTPHVDATFTADALKAGATGVRALVGPSQWVNGALYGPWIKVRGACSQCGGSDRGCDGCQQTGYGLVPASGHVAGVLTRLDHRVGVHRAPANEPMAGALDVQLALDGKTLSMLNAAGVNCIVALPGRGVRPWGARTLAPNDPDFSHVNMRRTYLTVARWLEMASTDLAFEPNGLRLWLRIQRQVSAFLDGLYRAGALRGDTAEEAYYVKCDQETNPPEVTEAGEVVAEIGVSLARPSEFVVLRLVTFAGTARADSA